MASFFFANIELYVLFFYFIAFAEACMDEMQDNIEDFVGKGLVEEYFAMSDTYDPTNPKKNRVDLFLDLGFDTKLLKKKAKKHFANMQTNFTDLEEDLSFRVNHQHPDILLQTFSSDNYYLIPEDESSRGIYFSHVLLVQESLSRKNFSELKVALHNSDKTDALIIIYRNVIRNKFYYSTMFARRLAHQRNIMNLGKNYLFIYSEYEFSN